MSERKTSFIFKRGEKMTRRELRENVFKMLFRVEFFDAGELSEQLVLFGEEVDHVTDKDFQYIAERYRDIYNHLSEIDEAINEVAKGWKTTRMGKVDLALIRLAVYEIRLRLRSMRLWNWQNNTEPMSHRHLSMEFLQSLQNDETCIFGRAGK